MENFQGIYWKEYAEGKWSRKITEPMLISEIKTFMKEHDLTLAWRLSPENVQPGYIDVIHSRYGRIKDEHAEYLGGYHVPPVDEATRRVWPKERIEEIDKEAIERVKEITQRPKFVDAMEKAEAKMETHRLRKA